MQWETPGQSCELPPASQGKGQWTLLCFLDSKDCQAQGEWGISGEGMGMCFDAGMRRFLHPRPWCLPFPHSLLLLVVEEALLFPDLL